MRKLPLSITINLVFILFNVIIWLALGIIIAVDSHPALPDSPSMKTGMAIISIVIAIILGGLAYLLFRHYRMAFYFTLAFFAFTSVLTIFDDFGASDLIVLIISTVPILLLIKDRGWYLETNQRVEEIA